MVEHVLLGVKSDYWKM